MIGGFLSELLNTLIVGGEPPKDHAGNHRWLAWLAVVLGITVAFWLGEKVIASLLS